MIYTLPIALAFAVAASAIVIALCCFTENGSRNQWKSDPVWCEFRGEVMQDSDAVWMWSEAFAQALERAMLDPPSDPAERLAWPKFCKRLNHWWRDVKEARKEYQNERPWQLRNLYSFWENVGLEDVREQAMLARHSYPRFRLWGWRARAALSNHSVGANDGYL